MGRSVWVVAPANTKAPSARAVASRSALSEFCQRHGSSHGHTDPDEVVPKARTSMAVASRVAGRNAWTSSTNVSPANRCNVAGDRCAGVRLRARQARRTCWLSVVNAGGNRSAASAANVASPALGPDGAGARPGRPDRPPQWPALRAPRWLGHASRGPALASPNRVEVRQASSSWAPSVCSRGWHSRRRSVEPAAVRAVRRGPGFARAPGRPSSNLSARIEVTLTGSFSSSAATPSAPAAPSRASGWMRVGATG